MALLIAVDPLNPDPRALAGAVEVLRGGGVVAYPTDTVYGLAADPRRSDAVRQVFDLKGRRETSALTLIAADVEQASEVAMMDATAAALARRWWPGPLTIVAPAHDGLAPETLAGGTTIGVRVPRSDVARAIARAFGFCITATSANRSGSPALADPRMILEALPHVAAIVDAGAAIGGAPSTIVEVADGQVRLVRDGAVPWNRVLESQQ